MRATIPPIAAAVLFCSTLHVASAAEESPQELLDEARVQLRAGNRLHALEMLERVRRAARMSGNRGLEAMALVHTGTALSDLGDKKRALESYEQALQLWREVSEDEAVAMTLNHIGLLHSAWGDKRRALEVYEKALRIRRELDDRAGEAATLNHIGGVYGELGDPRRALQLLELALAIFTELSHTAGEASVLHNMGAMYLQLGDNRRAIELYEQSLAIDVERQDRSATLNNLCHLHFELGDHRLALEFCERALSISRERSDRRGEATTLHNMGAIHSELGDKRRALALLEQALSVHREVGHRANEAATLRRIGSVHADIGISPRLAAWYGKQAVNVYQSLRGDIRGMDRDVQRTYAESVARAYRWLADLLASQGRLAEAQEVLSLLKEDELDQLVPRRSGRREARLSFTPDEAKALARYEEAAKPLTALAAEHAELWRSRERTPEQEERLLALQNQIAQGRGEFNAFLSRLAEEFGAGRAREAREIRENASLMRTLRELGPGAVAVFTLSGEKSLRTILVTPDLQRGYETSLGEAELGRKVLAFREALQDPSRDPRGPAKELYDAIVAPMAQDLEGAKATTIMWSLDGVLRYVPVAALYDGERWLVERYRSAVMTPGSAGRLTAAPRRRWSALGLGVTRAHEDLKPLPGVREELRTVVREKKDTTGLIPGERLLDEAFTLRSMMKGLASRPSIVHVASHYVFSSAQDASYLLMGDGGRFTLADLDALPATALEDVDLLALSACDTAMGRSEGSSGDLAGAEVDGLAMLAQQKGAAAVLATLWQVSDASTPELMREFYRRRKNDPGQSKAAALQAAQLTLLKGEARAEKRAGARRGATPERTAAAAHDTGGWTHPYHWAPFVLIGNWR